MKYVVPKPEKITEILSMILGHEVLVEVAPIATIGELTHVAEYINHEGALVSTCCLTLQTAAALGCAYSMIPPNSVENMISDRSLSQTATDNLHEILNIFSSVMMNDSSAHLKLDKVVMDNQRQLKGSQVTDIHFTLDLGAYGQGNILFNITTAEMS